MLANTKIEFTAFDDGVSTAQAITRKRLRALHEAFDQVFLGSDTEELPVCIYYCGQTKPRCA